MRFVLLITLFLVVGASRVSAQCSCWVEPDSSFTLVHNSYDWDDGLFGDNQPDDGSFGPIVLPFQFVMWGQLQDSVFINVNGNLSFDTTMAQFSPSGFPLGTCSPSMIAPFFADVDLRGTCGGCNAVHYKVTPTALYVNWTRVGYYAQNIDKLNSFQVIITDGTDPSVPDGNNVSFCYLDMQWTTGDASFGTNGFGGTPASVGANKGDGAGYAQIGRYDHAGNDYDGPFDNADGISWLDSTHFYFNVADTAGVPPIFASEFDCDTIEVQVGQTFDYHMLVIAGGPGQTITATSSCATLPSYQEIGNVPGSLATITSSVSPVPGEAGYHTVNYVAQNDLNTPQLSYANVVVHVLNGSPIGIEENDAHVPSLGCSVQGDQLLVTAGSGHSMEHLDLFTTEGRLLISRRVPNGSAATIDIGSLASGSYILRGTGPAGSAGARFVKN